MVRIARVVLLLHLVGLTAANAAPGRAARVAPAGAQRSEPPPAAPTVSTIPSKTIQRIPAPLNFDRLTYADGLPNSHITAILQDRIGFVWFGTQDGLVRYDGTRMHVYRSSDTDPKTLSQGYITALVLDADGKMWVGTAEHGANLYDPQTDTFTRFGMDADKATSGVTAIARDRKDRIWFALTRGGLNRYDAQSKTLVEYAKPPLDVAITAIDSDADGNLWLATAGAGLIRWNPDNGSSEVFKADDTAAFPAAPLTSVLATKAGTIWVGSDGEGVLSFEPKSRKLTSYRYDADAPSSLSDDHVTVLFEDAQQTLWVGTKSGLNQRRPDGGFVQYLHDPNDPTSLAFPGVESLFQDAGGVMWVGGFTVGACKFVMSRANFGRYRTRTHPVNSFHEDADGTLWVGTYQGGLYKYEWANKRVTLYHRFEQGTDDPILLEKAWIAALHRDTQDTLWIALQGQGLVAYDSARETYKHYMPDADNPTSIPVDTVWDIEPGANGKLWLASWGGGLVELDPATGAFEPLTTEDNVGLSSNHLYSLYTDPKEPNILWIGAAEGGLIRFDTTTKQATTFRHKPEDPSTLRSDDVLSIYRDGGGILWLGTYGGGLNRLDPASGKVQAFTAATSGLPNDVVFGILPDGDGRLWLSTNGGGLVRFDPKASTFQRYQIADGVQGTEFAQGAYMRSKSGKLFFGGVDGFNAFLPREISLDTYPPRVVLTSLKVYPEDVRLDQPIWTLPNIKVTHSDSFEIQFSALSFAAPEQNRYAYKLEGFDDKFIETDRPFATYTKLDGGTYQLKVRAANRHGVWSESTVSVRLNVKPPIWRTGPAYVVYVALLLLVIALVAYLQRQRVRRVMREGRLAVVERDLALTGAVQTGFLPEYNEIPSGPVRLFGFYRGADACSGDWWWHETLGTRHIILVGDVTGHGPGPAMVTAAVASAFRTLVAAGIGDLRTVVEVLHRTVQAVAKGKYTMTMAAMELDEQNGAWHLLSAGAPPIITLTGEGKHRVLFCAGTPLGQEGAFEPGELQGQLKPSERVLLYTDGIPEITMPNGQTLGMRRLAQLYERTRPQNLRDAATTIVMQADESNRGKPQEDDWTFTIVEWAGEGEMYASPPTSTASELNG